MASLLWTKAEHQRPRIYRDLFSDVSQELQEEFERWDQQLCHFEWENRFLNFYNKPIKSEMVAIRLGNLGNEYFEACQWRNAMEFYNQALCFAENDSEYMGILYAKRGFCFCNMNMYAAGMVDLDLALALKIPHEWVAESRQISAAFNQQTEAFKPLVPKLSFGSHADYEAMADVLELKFDRKKRACIVAKCDIDVGQTVLLEETFAAVTNSFNKTCCATCLNEIRNFIPCRMCTDAVFCCYQCYSQNRLHKISCGKNFHRMPTPIKFVIHSILEAMSMFPTADFMMRFVELYITSPNASAAAAKLKNPLDAKMQNYGLFLKQKIQNAMPMATVYQVYTTLLTMELTSKYFNTPEKLKFLMHLIGHHTMVLNCNAYGGFEGDQNQQICGTMANLVAMIEHSCTPNVAHFAHGSKEVCITIRPIRAGEHLCYDYWPDDDDSEWLDANDKNDEDPNDRADRMERRMKLRKQTLWECWRIVCQCQKCSMRIIGHLSNSKMAADPAFFYASNYQKYFGTNRTSQTLKEKCVQFLNEFKDADWSKEIEFITKTYSRCILEEYNREYGPPQTQHPRATSKST